MAKITIRIDGNTVEFPFRDFTENHLDPRLPIYVRQWFTENMDALTAMEEGDPNPLQRAWFEWCREEWPTLPAHWCAVISHACLLTASFGGLHLAPEVCFRG